MWCSRRISINAFVRHISWNFVWKVREKLGIFFCLESVNHAVCECEWWLMVIWFAGGRTSWTMAYSCCTTWRQLGCRWSLQRPSIAACSGDEKTRWILVCSSTAGRSGLVVACLPAAREVPGSNRAADKSFYVFLENHCHICSLMDWLHTDCSA